LRVIDPSAKLESSFECPACRCSRYYLLREGTSQAGGGFSTPVYRCGNCGFMFFNPMIYKPTRAHRNT
jgi:rubredoxin